MTLFDIYFVRARFEKEWAVFWLYVLFIETSRVFEFYMVLNITL